MRLATPYNMELLRLAAGAAIAAPGISAYCQDCGATYSASPGDYWNRGEADPLYCCGEPMVLAREERSMRAV